MVENYRYLFKFQEEHMKLVALVLVIAVATNGMALVAGSSQPFKGSPFHASAAGHPFTSGDLP